MCFYKHIHFSKIMFFDAFFFPFSFFFLTSVCLIFPQSQNVKPTDDDVEHPLKLAEININHFYLAVFVSCLCVNIQHFCFVFLIRKVSKYIMSVGKIRSGLHQSASNSLYCPRYLVPGRRGLSCGDSLWEDKNDRKM